MIQSKAKISILGCGWLGLPLAELLISRGYSVKGSTTSEEKFSILNQHGIKPYSINLSEKEIKGNLQAFLENSETLIVNIPPKLRSGQTESFVSKIKLLISELELSGIKNVLFVGSTAVYPDNNDYDITEETPTKAETENGRQLLEAESLFQKNKHFKTTIVRFGGLIGPNRNPITHLAGRENIENPDAPVNLIHLEDCIGIIATILEKKVWNEIFNAVAPYHPTREAYYQKKAATMNLALPKFAKNKLSVGKLISSEKIQKELGYTFLKAEF